MTGDLATIAGALASGLAVLVNGGVFLRLGRIAQALEDQRARIIRLEDWRDKA